MSRQELKTAYYTARRRYHAAPKGFKRAWYRELRRITAECLKAGV